jgi:hypothetical protein
MMVRLPAPFNARLHNIKEAVERDDLRPLREYILSVISEPDIRNWVADLMDPTTKGGYKLVIKGPPHRPHGGKALDRTIAIAEAVNQLMTDPADERSEQTKVEEVAARFSCSESKVRKDHSVWKKARGL